MDNTLNAKEVTRKIFNRIWDFAVENDILKEDEFHEEQSDVAGKKRFFVKYDIFNPYLESLKKIR